MNICRVCESKKIYANIFEYSNEMLLKMFQTFTDIQFDPNDCLPKHICENCLTNLEIAYKFKTQCENTDKKLRRLLDGSEGHKKNENNVYLVKSEEEEDPKQNEKDLKKIDLLKIHEVTFVECCSYSAEKNEVKEETEEELDSTKNKLMNVNEDQIVKICSTQLLDEIPEEKKNNTKNRIKIVEKFTEQSDVGSNEICNQSKDTVQRLLVSIEKRNENLTPPIKKTSKAKNRTTQKDKHYTCDTCNETFDCFVQFNEHKKSHGKQRHKCPDCGKWFKERNKLKVHKILHQNEKQFACNFCTRFYSNNANLKRHIRHVHDQEKKFACNTCDKRFSQAASLKHHLLTHTDDKPFECDLCHKWFKSTFYLNLHKKRHSLSHQERRKILENKKPDGKTFICEYCGKISYLYSNHHSHLRMHQKEKLYECYVCKKRFSTHSTLRQHIFTHTGERPYKCDVCHLAFRQYGHLQSHKLIHTNLKPYKCVICMKSFRFRTNLTVHMRLHTGETPFHCTQCPKKFYDTTGLKKHKLTHTKHVTEQNN